MTNIRLLVPDGGRSQLAAQVLANLPDVLVFAGNCDLDPDLEFAFPRSEIVVVDLACPRSTQAVFWAALHLRHPFARFVAITEVPVARAPVGAALQAGATFLVGWSEPPSRFVAAVRAAVHGDEFFAVGPILQAMVDFFGSSSLVPRSLSLGSLTLDLEQRCAWHHGQRVPLTDLEYELLCYLVQRAGQIVTHAELAHAIWHLPYLTTRDYSPIKSAIKRLRRKVELDPHQPKVILNTHGHGYYVARPSVNGANGVEIRQA